MFPYLVCLVYGPVNVDEQAVFDAVEVGNELSDRGLPPELQSPKPSFAQHFPQRTLGGVLLAAHLRITAPAVRRRAR